MARRAWSVTAISVVVVLVPGILAGLAYGAWASRHRTWSATTTFQVVPLPGTGDPDRVIATQIDVLESRTLHDRVAAQLGGPARFGFGAAQPRLSNVVEVTTTSAQQATATQAAARLTETYLAQVNASVPLTVTLTVLDPPLRATPTGDTRRDTVLVGLGGAALGAAVLVLFCSLRPRVKRSYEVAPVEAVVLELSGPGRAGSRRRADAAVEVRRFADHVIAVRGARRPHLWVSALAGVDDATLGWVTEVLSETSAAASEPSEPQRLRDGEDGRALGAPAVRTGSEVTLADGVLPVSPAENRPLSVLVARAGVDAETDLRKEVGSRAVFSEVVVVLLGAARTALVVPSPAHGDGRERRIDDGGPRTQRPGQAARR